MQKNIPKLRFKEFTEEWETKKLGEVGEVKMGQSPNSKSYNSFGEGLPLIQGNADISNRISKPRQWTNEPTKTCDMDSILLTVRAPVGSIAKSNHNACIGRGVCSIKNNHLSILEYIYQLLIWFEPKWISLAQGSIFTAVSGKDICNIEFLTPTLPEQKKIGKFLSLIDRRIELLEKKRVGWEQYKKGVMQKIFTQEIRFKDEKGENFPDWERKKLGEVGEIKKGKQLNKIELEKTGTYPAINGGIEPSGYTEEWNTLENTITISEGGNSCGYVNFIRTKFWSGGHCYCLLELDNKIVNDYLYQSLKFYQDRIMRLRVGSGLPNIQKGDINSFQLLFPQKEEQTKIADFLSLIDRRIEFLKKEEENLKKYKKGLLQKMFV